MSPMKGRWHLDFDAFKHCDPGIWKVGIASRLFSALRRNNHTVKLARIKLVEEVVCAPLGIFEGWSRPDMDDCYVYAGTPARDFRGFTIDVPAPPGMMFLVFILPDGTIDDWNWREVQSDDPHLPVGVKGRQVWPVI